VTRDDFLASWARANRSAGHAHAFARLRDLWLAHVASHPLRWFRFNCGMFYGPLPSDLSTCPRCGARVHENTVEWPPAFWEAVTENLGGGPRTWVLLARYYEGDSDILSRERF
jgi:hypothetical protein